MIKLIAPADVVTLINAGFGFLAILFLISPALFGIDLHVQIAFCLILLAILADGLDGIVARKTRHGKLGDYLEAMADMTSLGIAPAVFVYHGYNEICASSGVYCVVLVCVLLLFLVCGIIRLSSFHIIKEEGFFVGLPASAGTIVIIVFTFVDLPLSFMVVLLVVVSLLMLSPIWFLRPGIRINALAGIFILLSVLFRHWYMDMFPLLLLVAVLVYIIAGPVYIKIRCRQN